MVTRSLKCFAVVCKALIGSVTHPLVKAQSSTEVLGINAQGFRGDGTPPPLTDEVRVEAARRYIEAYELVTGQEFVPHPEPIRERVEKALAALKG